MQNFSSLPLSLSLSLSSSTLILLPSPFLTAISLADSFGPRNLEKGGGGGEEKLPIR